MPEDRLAELRKAKVLAELGFSTEVLSRMQKHLQDPANNSRPTDVDVESVRRAIAENAIFNGWGGGSG